MTLKQLEYLNKIVECGSITKAAQELYVSQPSLTKAVSSLEEEYHIKILVRKSRGVELTADGREFLHNARGVLSAVSVLDRHAPEAYPPNSRLFIATQQLDFIYQIFVKTYQENITPKCFYNLIESDRSDVIWQVLNNHADLGFVVRSNEDSKNILPSQDSKKLDIHVIDTGGCMIACGPKSRFWSFDHVSMEEASMAPQVGLDLEQSAKDAYGGSYGEYQFFHSGKMIFCNTVSACEYILRNTSAISFTSPWTTRCYTSPDIHIVPVLPDQAYNQLLWIKRAGEPLTKNEAYFLSLLYWNLKKPIPLEIAEGASPPFKNL